MTRTRTSDEVSPHLGATLRRRSRVPTELPSHVKHGTYRAYTQFRCGCTPCLVERRRVVSTRLARRYAQRVLVGGRWVSPLVRQHGVPTSYNDWGCRCGSCTRAWSDYGKSRRSAP